ncbi:MAG: SGNH/GDSL hydrolase family protein [Planctomycetes bacterium]|nr:SGNH/GDSL hydrolase family protein [Planctomycetota bacterium]
MSGDAPPRAPAPASPKRRRRRRLMALIALAFGLTLAVLLLELTLRLTDPIGRYYERETLHYFTSAIRYELPPPVPEGLPDEQRQALIAQLRDDPRLDGLLFVHKPDLDVSIGSFHLQTNSLGLRGPEVAMPKPADTFRVVMLGDSVTFGWGVDDEVTFARRLETTWNAGEPRTRLEVVNTGLPKYDTNQEAAMLRRIALPLDPDLVVLTYVTNDVSEPTRDTIHQLLTGEHPHPDEQIEIPNDLCSGLAEFVQPLLPATGALINRYTDIEARVQRVLPEGVSYSPETFGAGPRGWARSQRALLDIQAMCAGAGVPLVVFDHTLPRVESLRAFCDEHGIAYEPFYLSEQDLAQGITNSMLDSHCNAKGHDLLLQRMRAALERRGLLPPE